MAINAVKTVQIKKKVLKSNCLVEHFNILTKTIVSFTCRHTTYSCLEVEDMHDKTMICQGKQFNVG